MMVSLILCFAVCFKIFDTNHDGKLDHSELQEMIDCMVAIRMENKPLEELVSSGP